MQGNSCSNLPESLLMQVLHLKQLKTTLHQKVQSPPYSETEIGMETCHGEEAFATEHTIGVTGKEA